MADVLDELGVGDRAIALDAISCGGSSAFGLDFGEVLGVYDQPADVATTIKRAHPDAIVFAVQDIGTYNRLGIESFIGALNRGEKITIVCCNDAIYGHRGRQAEPTFTWLNTTGRRQFIIGDYPLHAAELAASFRGVAYSARGALTSPDEYQRTQSYIRTAFQKQMDNIGFSFVEILCACFSKYVFDETPIDCLKWIHEKMATELPLGEFKNVNRLE
jgi:2-oxoglutarate ferredoxin oxidoreductase subunit beta